MSKKKGVSRLTATELAAIAESEQFLIWSDWRGDQVTLVTNDGWRRSTQNLLDIIEILQGGE